jgi:2-keto-4-pentenoate hydratase
MLGTRPCRPGELEDLDVLGCVFRCRSGLETAAGGAAMGHPAAALVWLAAALAARGEAIEAGSIVLSGGLTASVPLSAGDQVTAEFDGLGSVTVRAA